MMHIGSGANGSAYRACSAQNSAECEYVIKVQPYNATAKRELDAYLRLHNTTIVPTLYAAWTCRNNLYLVLDRMHACNVSTPDLRRLLNRFLKLGWLHVDVHPGNVMCDHRNRTRLIDLGWAVHRDDQPYANHPTGIRDFTRLQKVQELNL